MSLRRPVEKVVVIRPRSGVDAARLRRWLMLNFQQGGMRDGGEKAGLTSIYVSQGNPLVNADIAIEERRAR